MILKAGYEGRGRINRAKKKGYNKGIWSKLINGPITEYTKGDFSINLINEAFRDIFYKKIDATDRKVKLMIYVPGYSSKACFRKANNSFKKIGKTLANSKSF